MAKQVGRPRGARVMVRCQVCGVESERRATDVQHNTTGRFFCSKRCRCQASLKPLSGHRQPCQICGETFYRYKSGHKKFCSRACYDVHQRRVSVSVTCEACGELYLRPPSKELRKYCSMRCKGRKQVTRALDWSHNGRPATLDKHGYALVYEPTHPCAKKSRIAHHRWVVEQGIGRILGVGEHVHHINGIKTDNRPENLQLVSQREHSRITWRSQLGQIEELKAKLAEYERRFGPLNES